ncbi:MAG: CBS domain-containing protein [bacterium]|nr:CBS domain-containing protein [bacterium]
MKTIEIMSTAPRAVRVIEGLDGAARVLWDHDCGIAPVVDAAGTLVGVVTDRDLCMAAYTQGCALSEIPVAAVMSRAVATCRPDDPVTDVMRTMQELRVHRLPVVNSAGELVGMVGTNDLVRASHARPVAVDPTAVIRTLAAIGAPRSVVDEEVASDAERSAAAAAEPRIVEARLAEARPAELEAEAEADGAAPGTAPVRRKPAAKPRATRSTPAKKTVKKTAKKVAKKGSARSPKSPAKKTTRKKS